MPYAKIFAVAALMLCAAPAFAQNAPGQEPPPVADKGTTIQADCLSENDYYVTLGKGVGFQIELTNKCEHRITCKVFAFITSAKGMAQGHGTIVLAPKSRGVASTGRFIMNAKMNGGSSQSTRECRVSS
jgi:hypothetical protein